MYKILDAMLMLDTLVIVTTLPCQYKESRLNMKMKSKILLIFTLALILEGINGKGNKGASDTKRQGIQTRIVGGAVVRPHEFPYLLVILLDKDVHCGATLINALYAVTSAQCVQKVNPSELTIIAGEHDLRKNDATEVTVGVNQIIIHEEFNRTTFHNDIAIVKFNESVPLSAAIEPAKLVNPHYRAKGSIWVIGWGSTREGKNKHSPVPRKVTLQVSDFKRCRDYYKKLIGVEINSKQFCAGFSPGGRDPCDGDSGTPATFHNGYNFYLVGIVSFGNGCGRANVAGVYTDASDFRGWIDKNSKI